MRQPHQPEREPAGSARCALRLDLHHGQSGDRPHRAWHPIAGKTYTFRAAPSALTFPQGPGVDAVSMANNHAADFGSVGLQDTLAGFKASGVLPIVGWHQHRGCPHAAHGRHRRCPDGDLCDFGPNDETSSQFSATATRPGIVSTNGTAGAAAWLLRSPGPRPTMVGHRLPHWGPETQTCPNDSQRRNAKALAAAGAVYRRRWARPPRPGLRLVRHHLVGYGLGNFIWYNNRGSSADTGVPDHHG